MKKSPDAARDTKSNNGPQSAAPAQDNALTDVGNARRFAEEHSSDIKFSHSSGKWLIWDGKRWLRDETGKIMERAKETADRLLQAAVAEPDQAKREARVKHAMKTQYESRLRAMINLAQSEPGIPITEPDLDRDSWILNVFNGALELKTGTLRRHRGEDLITKLIPVPYDPIATCPAWCAFVQRVTGDNAELANYLQKAVGYSLTGSIQEQVLFILYGTGANGKSTFLVSILSLLGNYACQTPTETLLTKWGDRIPNDIARLKGARFVTAAEAESGKQLAEAMVKQLTGGDKITARFLYGEFFEFHPTFKLFLAVNHKPTIRGSDHAIWRRIRLVPFNVTIPPDEQDKTLIEKLKKEQRGILRWAVDGCLLWQKEGLEPPEPVKNATDEYRSEMDMVADFIAERCELVPGAKTPFKKLYEAYKAWCSINGEDSMSKKEFGRCLTERDLAPDRNKTLGRFRMGIRLR
ncbi:MAG: phage/plasmid primase, P4 family [Deltaproteobacteria bacterium]|nr:phage/plasmid primase, P4 family [Deltaproteobacteria bacterium]